MDSSLHEFIFRTVSFQKPGGIVKRLNTLWLLPIFCIIVRCESHQFIEAGVIWTDDVHFNTEGTWYLALTDGCYSYCDGAITEIFEQEPIIASHNTVERFVVGANSGCNITAFVYLDANQNNTYDDGYDILTGYKYNYCTLNETTAISISAYY